MSRQTGSPGAELLALWRRLHRWPGGTAVFSLLLGLRIPYTGTIRPRVVELAPGEARVEMRDRRAVRNHLRSVHAVALTNLGELAGGLAMATALPPEVRGIVVRLETRFSKKARGPLVAEATSAPPVVHEPTDVDVVARIRDADGDVVAEVTALWRLGPR